MTGEQPGAPDGHPDDDLLSGHVDGELDPAVDAWVVGHLEGCQPCRRAVEELVEARAWLRGLPAVDASPLIDGFLTRHRHVVRLGVAFVGVAALVLTVVGLTAATHRRTLVPDVAALAANHRAEAHADMGGMERRASAAYVAPPGLIGSAMSLGRHEMWDGTDLAAIVYRDGDLGVSVYQQPGTLDWEGLPPGEIVALGPGDAWFGPGQPVVAVAQRGDLVVTVVSDDRAAVITAVAGMPDWYRRTTWHRVHDACQRLVQVFALDG